MRLVVVDLIPALLQWEGRDSVRVPPDAPAALDDMASRYRLVAIADADRSGADLRRILEDHHLGGYFESVGTAAGFGPEVSARVLRRLITVLRVPIDQVAVVTGRAPLADRLPRNGFPVVFTDSPDGFSGVPDALQEIESGRITP